MLKKLNALGYGTDSDLVLNMVYNPSGAFFPPNQQAMETEYKEKLGREYGISFNNLFCITNNPIGRLGNFSFNRVILKDICINCTMRLILKH